MEDQPTNSTLRVTGAMVDRFAQASGDVSPLHVDEAYARQTPFGEPVAHGVLVLLLGLAAGPARQGLRLSRLRVRFIQPVLRDRPYVRVVEEVDGSHAVIRVLDGPRSVLEAKVEFSPGDPAVVPAKRGRARFLPAAAVLPIDEMGSAGPLGTEYRPDWSALLELVDEFGLPGRGVDVEHVAVLCWASYVAGMRVPGRAALVSGLEVGFGRSSTRRVFAAEGQIAEVDIRFKRVVVTGEVTAGRTAAQVAVTTFVRREHEPPDPAHIRQLLAGIVRTGDLRGKVALVCGGSRGLGAALVQGLAVAGSTVYVGFDRSRAAAEALVEALQADGARVHLVQGDASDSEWCAAVRDRIMDEEGRIDFLVLNAGPPVENIDPGAEFADRAASHVERARALAQTPLSACAADLGSTGGFVVGISSSYVDEPRKGLAHYVAAKRALEGLLHAAELEHSGLRTLIVRPPRLATTFADSAVGDEEALPVEPAAAAIVRRLIRADGGLLEDFTVTDDQSRGDTGHRGTLALAGTFTLDPLIGVLEHWTEQLGLDLDVVPAAFGQVFQELLDPRSIFGGNRRGANVALVRLQDWPAGDEGTRTVDEFVTASRSHSARSAVPLLVIICPSARADQGCHELEERLAAGLAGTPGVHLVRSGKWAGGYRLDHPFDHARDELAHIPYMAPAYAALGTTVVRAAHSLLAAPFKVLVLDCDNTLWHGVCGEDGPEGIELRSAHRYLQQWAVRLHDQGVLICLASKNADVDVDEVFRQRSDFPLRPAHIAARRVNWDDKASNLRELANELNLGLDSMVFLDDNPVEIAQVNAAHPSVLALRLPEAESEVPAFVDRIWAFDKATVTDEDRMRTESYRASLDRQELRRTAITFHDFIAGLQLQIDVHEAEPDELPRVAQLTQRTNQFNLSTIRRTDTQLKADLATDFRCWIAKVRDRFGDYGLVGAAIVRDTGNNVELDSFLMSCRVLGRGVEHAFMAALGRELAGKRELTATYAPSAKNTPARRFFDQVLGPAISTDHGIVYRASMEQVAAIAFQAGAAENDQPAETVGKPVQSPAPNHVLRLAALAVVANDLRDVEALQAWVRAGKPRTDRLTDSPTSGASDEGQPDTFEVLQDVLTELLSVSRESLRADTTLESIRLSSLEIVDATVALEKRFGQLPRTLFFEHRHLGELAAALPGSQPKGSQSKPALRSASRAAVPAPISDGVAVVGIAGRYPGSADIGELWRNLLAGRDLVGDVVSRWGDIDAVDPAGGLAKTYTSAGGLVDGVDEFDPMFFGIAPSEAETMDPQQRLLLQIAYHALEDAGHTAADLGQNVGVYIGAMSSDYALFNAEAALTGQGRYPNADLYQLANRISHFFDFTGPSLVVDTACSASGVALQLAFEAIHHGSVTAALVGGVNLILHPARRVQYAQLGMLSRVGRCQPFGANADGMVTSEGIGALLLRPVRDAIMDGDQIYGVIKAIGTNSDGRTNGFMVPSPVAQARLISSTLSRAGVAAASVSYVEAHGTGTPLGDPIEIRGLTEAFGFDTPGPIAIGSVKSNVGHLEAAAAVIGLSKVLLQLKHDTLVPSLHAAELNPHIAFDETPFEVQRDVRAWPRTPGQPRRAGVSSFGAGGVNVHLVVEDGPFAEPSPSPTQPELILMSARDPEQLRESCARLADHLRGEGKDVALADLAFTLRTGREGFAHRFSFVAADREHFTAVLDRLADGETTEDVQFGHVGHDAGLVDVFDGSAEMNDILSELVRRGRLGQLGRLWSQGAAIDWGMFLPRTHQQRVSLPGYPFRAVRFPLARPSMKAVGRQQQHQVTYYRPMWTYVPQRSANGIPERCRTVVLATDSTSWSQTAETLPDVSALAERPDDGDGLVVVDRRDVDDYEAQLAPNLLDTAMTLARMATRGRPVTYVYLSRPAAEAPASAAVTGFARALSHETSLFRTIRLEIAGDLPAFESVLAEIGSSADEVRLQGDERQVRSWQPVEVGSAQQGFRSGGSYLITGGAGGIGRLVATHLTSKYRASVALIGRSAAPDDLDGLIDSARLHGGALRYVQADVTDEAGLTSAIDAVRESLGQLHGVIHAAGIAEDGLFKDKSVEAIGRVLAPKATGAVLVDRATAADELDFFVLTSSIIGVFGNVGQTDYAAANRFLDAFAEWRSEQVRIGTRHGRSISILWPIWESGGMRMPQSTRTLLATTLGQQPISNEAALHSLDTLVSIDQPIVLVGCGDQERIAATLEASRESTELTGHVAASPVSLVEELCEVVADLINVDSSEIDTTAEFGDYGFNSLLFTDLANRLNERFELALSPVVFFENPTVNALAAVLQKHNVLVPRSVAGPTLAEPRETQNPPAAHTSVSEAGPQVAAPVAVIGMSGRLPGSPDLDRFWDNLIDKRCLTGDQPSSRTTLSGWNGGFLDDVTAFDAAFFGISPREARLMDPQQRLFLEASWSAIEDAGYDPRSLAGAATGVFAAVTLHDYSELLKSTGEQIAGHTITGHVHGVIANRLSYLLNLAGPSEVVDTACSSSLTAIHRAVLALQAGECDTAVVGGVNVLLTADWFESLDKAGVLSATGRCWSFDGRADGFVRSEGVGVVILKPLHQALSDGDTVRGVIRGTAVNHGGRAHSLTAPNPAGQAAVVVAALKRAGVDPRTVSYVETHGTGTKLGDPIEVAGLCTAFEKLGATGTEPWCHLGAVKANVGHLESAAGMAGLLKVLLAFQHGVLPPNVTGQVPNPHLELHNTPFSLLHDTTPWQPTTVDGHVLPRRAGVSAFGFGGANAHVVLEEPPSRDHFDAATESIELTLLSAATTERLREYAIRLREVLGGTVHTLADLAYTSRIGRGAFSERLAVTAATKEQLAERLAAYIEGVPSDGLFVGTSLNGGQEVEASDDPVVLARAWVTCAVAHWPADPDRRRVPFPTYPFDHSTSHGPSLLPAGGIRPATEPKSESHMPRLFRRVWEPAELSHRGGLDGRPLCLLVVGSQSCLPLLEALPGHTEADWIVLREPSALPSATPHEYEVDFEDYQAGREVAQLIIGCHGPIEFVVDLVDVSDGAIGTGREAARIGVLQALTAQGKSTGLRFAHLTRNVAPVENAAPRIAGARLAGLVRAVGAEYAAVRTVTVDIDCTPDDGHQQIAIALRELAAAGDEPEVAYRAGVRYAPRVRAESVKHHPHAGRLGAFDVDPQRTYLVTGGTGGLGLAAAEKLVEQGARRIALTGTRPLPARGQWGSGERNAWWADRVAAVRRMEAAGAEVHSYFGSLTDEAELRTFVGKLGTIAGVLHCAGLVSPTPAFLHKTFGEIAHCWEPKGEGLLTLQTVIADHEPDFVVLYSSLSAVIPELATGLSDYASANSLLDAIAAQCQSHAQRRGSRTKYLAINWGSWTGLGMGEVTSPRYSEMGLGALTQEQGLSLLDQALATSTATSLIAVSGALGEDLPAAAEVAQESPPVGDLRLRCVEHLRETFAEVLLMDAEAVRPEARFADLGVDSILIAAVVPRLETIVGTPLEPSVILEHPSVDRLADHLLDRHHEEVTRWAGAAATVSVGFTPSMVPAVVDTSRTVPIAIIGMSGRFPGAENTEAFWDLLRAGRSGISEVPRSRWDVASLYSPVHREGMSISKWGGFLHGIEEFDPEYFGIPAEDAAHMDPLTRLFLECAGSTFADAGYPDDDIAGRRIGVFAGSGTSNYGSRIRVPGRATATGLNQNFIAAHLAQVYDLRGPNLVVDTACSSSLTSLYLARQALLLDECEMALVGGADLLLDETPYLSLSAARALSPDGACHVFDAEANGLVPGEGVGAVLLKRLDRALADGDRVLAVIESVAMNNDGRTMGLTTPNPDAQQDVVLDALDKAAVDARTVSYVEAHGTGTMIGDPIELRALSKVFERFTNDRGFCAVGSVKSNLGHLLMAAGMASLQKVVLSLVNKALPPTLHCAHPNPRFAFDASPFFPNTDLREWRPREGVRRAGISAFGFGGTNCHAIVRELIDDERDHHVVRRTSLPQPVYQRRRHWVDRERPVIRVPRPMLELEELT